MLGRSIVGSGSRLGAAPAERASTVQDAAHSTPPPEAAKTPDYSTGVDGASTAHSAKRRRGGAVGLIRKPVGPFRNQEWERLPARAHGTGEGDRGRGILSGHRKRSPGCHIRACSSAITGRGVDGCPNRSEINPTATNLAEASWAGGAGSRAGSQKRLAGGPAIPRAGCTSRPRAAVGALLAAPVARRASVANRSAPWP